MIFLFITIVMLLLTATISYYKGFKVNSRILLSINKYAGYNALSIDEIENYLSSIGYTVSPSGQEECGERKGLKPIKAINVSGSDTNYLYCVYYHENDNSKANETKKENNSEANETKEEDNSEANEAKEENYYSYSVVSYIYVDLPIVGNFKVPVYTKGERIYNFNDGQKQKGVTEA